ncbi:MAG: hypothetical protein F6K42_21185 [Leptolyngbya sp. SIO1D8]|nr:hypothetical protein [Leptolyngbya sp. SIO1D8]
MCEWFKAGATKSQLEDLVASAMTPEEFLTEWIKHWETFPPDLRARCVQMAITITSRLKTKGLM